MSEIHILLLCGLFFMPIVVILAMGVFWAYVWVKDGLSRINEDKKDYEEALTRLTQETEYIPLNKVISNLGLKRNDK